jgi:cytochrome b involved in lipid metabolism
MPAPANTITLTPAEVAKHSTPDDCWMIIDGTVYDLSGFAPQHSGGSVAIAAFCGQDGSQAFDTRGGTGSHRSRDRELLATAALGAVGATIAG